MSSVDELADLQAPSPDAASAAQQLDAMFELARVGLAVTGARVVGHGSSASADVYLSDGSEINFERMRDIAKPLNLNTELAACTGVTPGLKGPQAMRAITLIRALATHHVAFTEDDIARDWGTEYLQTAEVLNCDIGNQHERWRAFSHLDTIHPFDRRKDRGGGPLAAATVVLEHSDGTRLVRTGWYCVCVRLQDASISAQALSHRMQRVGWSRRGSTGRIKATRPAQKGELGWCFYEVAPGWEGQS